MGNTFRGRALAGARAAARAGHGAAQADAVQGQETGGARGDAGQVDREALAEPERAFAT